MIEVRVWSASVLHTRRATVIPANAAAKRASVVTSSPGIAAIAAGRASSSQSDCFASRPGFQLRRRRDELHDREQFGRLVRDVRDRRMDGVPQSFRSDTGGVVLKHRGDDVTDGVEDEQDRVLLCAEVAQERAT